MNGPVVWQWRRWLSRDSWLMSSAGRSWTGSKIWGHMSSFSSASGMRSDPLLSARFLGGAVQRDHICLHGYNPLIWCCWALISREDGTVRNMPENLLLGIWSLKIWFSTGAPRGHALLWVYCDLDCDFCKEKQFLSNLLPFKKIEEMSKEIDEYFNSARTHWRDQNWQ